MSLHDMYFSKKNKNHVFTLIRDIILNDTNIDISQNTDYIDLYRIKYSLVFERINTDNLIDLNKALIDEIAPLFMNDIQSKKNITIPKLISEKNNNDTENKDEYQENKMYINSTLRSENSINRYNYSFQIGESINKVVIQEITIPEEDNILFLNPIICVVLTIDENKYNNYCKLNHKNKVNNRVYNTYTPIKRLEIQCTSNDIKIEIVNNALSTIMDKTDKIGIKKIKKINYENKDYLGILLKENHSFKEKDSIGIYKNNTLVKMFIIDRISERSLLILNEEIHYDNKEEYYLLNMNLQNNILLHY